jgi:urease accessory protein
MVCSTAVAHPLHGLSAGGQWSAGFGHPWSGLDHILAMFAIGLLSIQLGGRAVWVLPASFLAAMTLGGLIGIASASVDLEPGIALTVLVLGVALAVGAKYPLPAAAAVTGLFGLLHGHVHGTEIPTLAAPLLFSAGFLSATALLHAAGIAVAACLSHYGQSAMALRATGLVVSSAGLWLLVARL